ncbi:MAG TPA: hypothetical protein VHE32_09825 [Rhodanobacteraceae bacterium]|jgi:hypothetical protein|nr:hypothetical protein [Rhodanobacteraceae bacterium]
MTCRLDFEPRDANKQAADIRDGSRTTKQLAQVEPTEEREGRDETNGPSAEAYRARGIAPALAPAIEGNAEREAREIERTIQQTDPSYRIPKTTSGLGNDNPIDRLDAAREELEARQAKFLSDVLPQKAKPPKDWIPPTNPPQPKGATKRMSRTANSD